MEQTRALQSAQIVFFFYPSYYHKPQISHNIVKMIEALAKSPSQDFPSMSWRHDCHCCLTLNCFVDATLVNAARHLCNEI